LGKCCDERFEDDLGLRPIWNFNPALNERLPAAHFHLHDHNGIKGWRPAVTCVTA
jgi:hypothetical protein